MPNVAVGTDDVAARAVRDAVAVRADCAIVVALRAGVGTLVAARALRADVVFVVDAAARPVGETARVADVVAARPVDMVVFVRPDVSVRLLIVLVVVMFFARDVAPPTPARATDALSRTAASAAPMQNKHPAIKGSIFFIPVIIYNDNKNMNFRARDISHNLPTKNPACARD